MEQSKATMETQRWFQLAAVLALGVLIGYGVAHATAPERRYTIERAAGVAVGNSAYLYRYDNFTGKTWITRLQGSPDPWKEVK